MEVQTRSGNYDNPNQVHKTRGRSTKIVIGLLLIAMQSYAGIPYEADGLTPSTYATGGNPVYHEKNTETKSAWFYLNSSGDCNSNGINDLTEIAEGTATDCNTNGVPDVCDLSSNDCNSNAVPDDCEIDVDGDRVIDACDNCPNDWNIGQCDFDLDGIGNLCDEDIDNDGVLNNIDVCDYTPAEAIVEPDGGMLGDLDLDCDVDLDDYAVMQTRFTGPSSACANGDEITLDLGDGVEMKLVRIPAGSFIMGSTNGEPTEQPVHDVTVSQDFYMGKFEVTQIQYQTVTGVNPSYSPVCNDCPVETVTWFEAVAFCQALSVQTGYKVRLPSEAEWEYSCRAGTTTAYYFGNDIGEIDSYAWHNGNSDGTTHAVGGVIPNAWDLYDMHGNVWEWCSDWYDPSYYTELPAVDPMGPLTGDKKSLRGGAWYVPFLDHFRSAYRNAEYPSIGAYNYGFRVVISN